MYLCLAIYSRYTIHIIWWGKSMVGMKKLILLSASTLLIFSKFHFCWFFFLLFLIFLLSFFTSFLPRTGLITVIGVFVFMLLVVAVTIPWMCPGYIHKKMEKWFDFFLHLLCFVFFIYCFSIWLFKNKKKNKNGGMG